VTKVRLNFRSIASAIGVPTAVSWATWGLSLLLFGWTSEWSDSLYPMNGLTLALFYVLLASLAVAPLVFLIHSALFAIGRKIGISPAKGTVWTCSALFGVALSGLLYPLTVFIVLAGKWAADGV
jgi:hypothetical protein